jgi:dolichyl-phosphate beta-glucosyltransferase
MTRRSLTVVLPAYNEAERIGPALDELFGYLRRRGDVAREGAPGAGQLPERIDVLVVDDGSTDDTVAIVRGRPEAVSSDEATSTLSVLPVPHAGKGAAVRAGMLHASTDLVIFADADMATPPDMIPLLVAALESADVALGSRIQADGSDMRASQPAYRRLLGKAFHLVASMWVVGPVKDTQCLQGFHAGSRTRPVRSAADP